MPPSPLPVFGRARVFELGGPKFNIGGITIQHRVPLIQHRVLRIQLRVLLIQHRRAHNSTSQCYKFQFEGPLIPHREPNSISEGAHFKFARRALNSTVGNIEVGVGAQDIESGV